MVPLHDIMSVDLVTASPEDSLREIAELLTSEHITGVPVADGERADVMTRTLCALLPDATAREGAEYMLRAGVHRVLVIDDERLVGVVTTTDLVEAVSQHGLAG